MLYVALAVCVTSTPPAEALTLKATLPAEHLAPGGRYEIILEVHSSPGWSASGAGVPAPLLQLDVPAAARLEGAVLTGPKELAGNEFLMAPFERQLKQHSTRIPFELLAPPPPMEGFGLNVMAYVSTPSGDDGFFIRRRLELPLAPGATAVEVDPNNSEWGPDRQLLQIGDVATDFNLPRADGSSVALNTFRGHKNVLVTTYRAHW